MVEVKTSRQAAQQPQVSAARGTSYLILIQVVSRVLTFASNQLVLRRLSPEVFGVATQLELYYITVIFFSRECLRAAIQREPLARFSADGTEKKNPSSSKNGKQDANEKEREHVQDDVSRSSQTVVNMSYLAIALGILLSSFLGVCYHSWATTETALVPFFYQSVQLVGISCVIELGTEPFFAVVQQRMLYKERAAVEMTAAFARSIVTCGFTIWASWKGWYTGVLPFGLGYLAFACALLSGYSWQMLTRDKTRGFSFWLTPIQARPGAQYLLGRFSRRLVWLGTNMYLQSIVKHFLTQGDSMILAAFSTLEDQGIYALASNYGGLVARMIFQPIEESCRNIWTGQLNTTEKDNRGHKTYVEAAKSQLVNVLRTYSIFGILALSIGPSTIPIFLRFLIGSRWMSPKVQELLATYCCYIPFLAFNGITEAFVSASASPSDMRRHAVWLSVFSACFCLVSFLLLNVADSGAVGLVWANVINMSIRTIWSFFYIRKYLRTNNSDLQVSEFSPNLQTFGVLVLAASRTAVEPISPSYDDLFYNVFVLGFAAVCGVMTLVSERAFILAQYKSYFRA